MKFISTLAAVATTVFAINLDAINIEETNSKTSAELSTEV